MTIPQPASGPPSPQPAATGASSHGEQLSLLNPEPAGSANGRQRGEHQRIERPGLQLRRWPRWLMDAPTWQERLEREVAWRQESITLRGRIPPLPRLTFCSIAIAMSTTSSTGFAADEAELDPETPIASLSLGVTRCFRPRPRDRLVMDPHGQRHWLHQVPQRLRLQGSRLNLTSRVIRPEAIC